MAEIFFITRGHHDHIDKFVRSMRNLYFPFVSKEKTTGGMDVNVTRQIDGQLRPYQLWGYVCPEQFMQPLCNSLGIPTEETWLDTKINEKTNTSKGGNSFISGFGVKGILTALRLALGAEKLPKVDMEKGILTQPIYRDHINVLGIGFRKDMNGKTRLGEHELI